MDSAEISLVDISLWIDSVRDSAGYPFEYIPCGWTVRAIAYEIDDHIDYDPLTVLGKECTFYQRNWEQKLYREGGGG